jgi:hypothetical protein
MKPIDAVESCYTWGGSNVDRIEAASIDTLGTKGCSFSLHVGVNGYITPLILNLGTRLG